MLKPEEERKIADQELDIEKGNDEGSVDLSEEINIEVSDPKDDPAFISTEEEETKSDEELEKDGITVPGLDKTGRNKAFAALKHVEKTTLKTFDELDDAEDRDPFEEYLLKNLFLYADVYENELDKDPPLPAGVEDAVANVPQPEEDLDLSPEDPAEEEDIANIELQELLKHLDIDDIVKNLL